MCIKLVRKYSIKIPIDIISIDYSVWSTTNGDAGDSTHEGIPDAVSDWQIQQFWVSICHSADLGVLGLVLWSTWLAAVVNFSLGPAQAEEADWV